MLLRLTPDHSNDLRNIRAGLGLFRMVMVVQGVDLCFGFSFSATMVHDSGGSSTISRL